MHSMNRPSRRCTMALCSRTTGFVGSMMRARSMRRCASPGVAACRAFSRSWALSTLWCSLKLSRSPMVAGPMVRALGAPSLNAQPAARRLRAFIIDTITMGL